MHGPMYVQFIDNIHVFRIDIRPTLYAATDIRNFLNSTEVLFINVESNKFESVEPIDYRRCMDIPVLLSSSSDLCCCI